MATLDSVTVVAVATAATATVITAVRDIPSSMAGGNLASFEVDGVILIRGQTQKKDNYILHGRHLRHVSSGCGARRRRVKGRWPWCPGEFIPLCFVTHSATYTRALFHRCFHELGCRSRARWPHLGQFAGRCGSGRLGSYVTPPSENCDVRADNTSGWHETCQVSPPSRNSLDKNLPMFAGGKSPDTRK
jgi:hypothetical protein